MSIDITVIGSTNLDITATVPRLPGPGETLLGTSLTHAQGGKGANQALAASRAGAAVRFIGAVGDDSASDTALSLLVADGVDLSQLVRVPGTPTGTALIAVDDAGENNIIVIAGANAALDGELVADRREQIEGLVVLQGEIPASGLAAAVQDAPGRVLLNLAPVIEVPREVLLAANPLVVNEHEGAMVLQQLGANPSGLDDAAVVGALRAHGIASVVMTRGAQGALVSQEATQVVVPSVQVSALDATGAGDAFVGALAARLAAGESLEVAAAFAARFAADSVTRAGAQSSYPAKGAISQG